VRLALPAGCGGRAMSPTREQGERTRRRIVEKAAPVFNIKGYFGTSMSDLVRETGLKKGGIYGHFDSKEELAVASFEYAAEVMRERFTSELASKSGALEKLFAIIDVLSGMAEDPPVAGGCPVLNTAVESDDANPVLKERAQDAMSSWLRLVGRTVKDGVRGGELSAETDPREMASLVVGTLEGALMLCKLFDDPAHMERAVVHLKRHIGSLARPGGGSGGQTTNRSKEVTG
jgi:TetR/AcrR family transcriptional regulator, transcriptional repressor for nem operon